MHTPPRPPEECRFTVTGFFGETDHLCRHRERVLDALDAPPSEQAGVENFRLHRRVPDTLGHFDRLLAESAPALQRLGRVVKEGDSKRAENSRAQTAVL